MKRRDTWFTRQLEAAKKYCDKLPEWARKEAGLKPK